MKKLLMILASTMLLFACNDDQGVNEDQPGPEAQIEIDAETLVVTASGDFAQDKNEVTVTSSGDWRLTGLKTWCKPSVTEGVSSDKVTFVADENTTGAPRSITYTFFCENKAVKLVVTQQQNDEIDLSESRLEIGSEGAKDLRIQVISTVDYQANVEFDQPGEAWILPADVTRAAELSYLYYSVAANDTYAARSGRIIVTGKNSDVVRTITVSQKQNDELRAEQNSYNQPQEASTLRMTVWSNIPYAVEIPKDATWITLKAQPVDPTEWSSQELVFELAAADKYRVSAINLVAKDGSKIIPIGIQQGEALIFPVPDQNFREYLLGLKYIETLGDGYTMTAAGVAATALDTYTTLYAKQGCESLEGVQYFTNLVTLKCQFNRLRALDISKNTKISDIAIMFPNPIESLSVPDAVTKMAASGKLYNYYSRAGVGKPYTDWATKLVVTGAMITTIDVSQNHLGTLDVSGCPSLTTLKCIQASGYTLQSITLSESQRGKVTIDNSNVTLIYK